MAISARCWRRTAAPPSASSCSRWSDSAASSSSIPVPVEATVERTGTRQPTGGRASRPAQREHPLEVADRAGRAVVVGLVHHENVGDLQDPGLGRLNAVAHPGRQHDQHGVGQPHHRDLVLADADGFDQHIVKSDGGEQVRGGRGRRGQSAELPPTGHRADVDAGVGGVLAHPDPVAEQRAAAERAGRIDGQHGHPPARRAIPADQRGGEGRFPDPGWTGEAHDARRAAGRPTSARATSAARSPPDSIRLSNRAMARTEPPSAAASRSSVDDAARETMRSNLLPVWAATARRYGGSMTPADAEPTADLGRPPTLDLQALDIIAIDHVGIAVPDLEAAIAFHTERARRHSRAPRAQRGAGRRGGDDRVRQRRPGAAARAAVARSRRSRGSWIAAGPGCSNSPSGCPTSGSPPQQARAAGIRTLYDEPRRGTAGSSINFLHPKDAGGVLVELVQAPAVTAAPEH